MMMRNSQAREDVDPDFNSPENQPPGTSKELAERGYLHMSGVFDPELVAGIAHSIIRSKDLLLETSRATNLERSRVLGRGGGLARRVERDGTLRPITESDALGRVLRQCGDWTPLASNQQALRFVPAGYRLAGNPFVTPIHQEASAFQSGCSSPWQVLTVWIPLVACSRLNGTLVFARGSARNFLKHWRKDQRDLGVAPTRATERVWLEDPDTSCVFGSHPLQEEHRWHVVDCRPGDAVLFTEKIAHAGLGNGSRLPRISLDLRFSPARGFIRWDQRAGADVEGFARTLRAALAATRRGASERGHTVRREDMLLAFERLMAEGPVGAVSVSERVAALFHN